MTMQFELHKNGIAVPEELERVILQKRDKIEERLKRYHPDVAELEVRLAETGRANEYECGLKLAAFKDVLTAKKSHTELRVAVDRAFEAIMKELDTYRAKINKSLSSGA